MYETTKDAWNILEVTREDTKTVKNSKLDIFL
jgi:hypothetical protein